MTNQVHSALNGDENDKIVRRLQLQIFKGHAVERRSVWRVLGVEIECRNDLFWRVVGSDGRVYDDFEEDGSAAWRQFFELVERVDKCFQS